MRIDKDIHNVFNFFSGNDIRWHDFHEVGLDEYYYDYYYAEDCLYVIRDRIYEKYYFVEARSPKQALDSMKEISEMIARSHYDLQAESEDEEEIKADVQSWWDGLSSHDKETVMSIPNFDADIFFECTGIRV